MYETTLLQINLGHRRAASYDLQLRTRDLKSFGVLIQEPWVVRNKVVGLSNVHKLIVASCEDKNPPRAAIYHHRDLKIAPHPAFTGRDVAAGIWDVGTPTVPQMMLISAYWDGKSTVLPQKLIDCLDWCRDNKLPIHLGGDFNAHSTLWGGKERHLAGKSGHQAYVRL